MALERQGVPEENPWWRKTAGVLLKDEARRMAVNFARLPELLGKTDREARTILPAPSRHLRGAPRGVGRDRG
jgi:hypothetical protein